MSDDSKMARDVIVAALTARHEELSGEASSLDNDGARQILRALDGAGFEIVRRASTRVYTEPRKREFVTGYLMDGRTVDLIKENVSRCGDRQPHEVHYPDLKAGQGTPAVQVAGTYVCPGVPVK